MRISSEFCPGVPRLSDVTSRALWWAKMAASNPQDSSKRQIKASSYIAQYPVLRTVQSALHFTSLTDLFTQTPSWLLWEASSHMCEGCSYTYQPLSIARYSFIQLSELELCRGKKLAQGFNTAAQVLNPCSRSRESGALPLSHFALHFMLHCQGDMFISTYTSSQSPCDSDGKNIC